MESRTWSEALFDFLESAFGLAIEVGRTVVQRVIVYVKWVLLRGGIGIVVSAIFGVLGVQFVVGFLVFIGIVGMGVSFIFIFVALAPAVLLLWTAEEKSETIQRFTTTAFVVMASFLIMGVYVVVFRAWHNREFWVLMPTAMILIMISVVRGSFVDPKAITRWAVRVSIIVMLYVVVSMAIEKVPEFYRTRVTDSAQTLVGLNSDEVPFESIDKFFSTDGKPRVWYIEYKGQRHFFLSPGYDQRRGQARIPVTAEIVDQEEVVRAQVAEEKLAAEKKAADEQKALVDAEIARLKAEVEAERLAQEAVQAEERRLASLPVTVVSTLLAPDNNEQDVVLVRPDTSFKYKWAMVDSNRAVVMLDIIDVQPAPAPEKDKYVLTLQPHRIMLGRDNQNFDILREANPIQLLVKKDGRNIFKKLVGGDGVVRGRTLVNASAGTVVAISSHGKKFLLVVGAPVPPIIITPIF